VRGDASGWKLVDMRENQRAEKESLRPRRSRAEWSDEVRRWRESGQTAAEYAAGHGLHAGTLAAWGSKIGDIEAAPGRSVAFLPVRVAEPASKESAPATPVMEVVLRNGRRVRVGGGFDGDAVARLLDVAERGGRC
jgi:hypothetical protein